MEEKREIQQPPTTAAPKHNEKVLKTRHLRSDLERLQWWELSERKPRLFYVGLTWVNRNSKSLTLSSSMSVTVSQRWSPYAFILHRSSTVLKFMGGDWKWGEAHAIPLINWRSPNEMAGHVLKCPIKLIQLKLHHGWRSRSRGEASTRQCSQKSSTFIGIVIELKLIENGSWNWMVQSGQAKPVRDDMRTNLNVDYNSHVQVPEAWGRVSWIVTVSLGHSHSLQMIHVTCPLKVEEQLPTIFLKTKMKKC